jgi:hypothetical protein
VTGDFLPSNPAIVSGVFCSGCSAFLLIVLVLGIAAFLLIVPAIVTRIAPDPFATLMIWCVIVPSELALCFLRRVDTVYRFAEMLPLCGTASCLKFPSGVRSGLSVENPISFRSNWSLLPSRSFFSGFPILFFFQIIS